MSYVFSPALRAALRRRRILTPTAFSGGGSSLADALVNGWSSSGDGLAMVFETAPSIYVKDSGTPANNTNLKLASSLSDFSAYLTYTNPHQKIVRQSDGYYKHAAHNLLSNTTDLTVSPWAGTCETPTGDNTNGWSLIPDATTTQHSFAQDSIPVISGSTFAYHLEAKANGLNFIWFNTISGGPNNDIAFVDLSDGTEGTVQSSVTVDITPLGDDWYDIIYTFEASSTSLNVAIYPAQSDLQTGVWTRANDTDGILVRNLRIYQKPADSTFLPTTGTSTPRYALPIQYDSSGVAEGLLVEPQATNLVTQNVNMENGAPAAFGAVNGTTSANQTTGPDGLANSASKFAVNSSTAQHYTLFSNGFSVTAAAYTFSVFAKANGYDFLWFNTNGTGAVTNDIVFFDLANGTVETEQAGVTGRIEDAGGGWYRCSATWTFGGAATLGQLWMATATADGQTGSFLGDGSSGFYFAYPQFELSSVPTSPIITNGGTVTRDADDIEKVNGFPTSNQRTLYVKFEPVGEIQYGGLVSLSDGTTGNRELIRTDFSKTDLIFQSLANAGTQASLEVATSGVTAGSTYKVAGASEVDNFAATYNGNTVLVDNSGTPVEALNEMQVGRSIASVNELTHSLIKEIAYYPERLRNEYLEAITAGNTVTLWTDSEAQYWVNGETDALSLDFTDDFWQSTTGYYGSAYVIDTSVEGYDSHPDGLLDVGGNTEQKMVLGPSGTLQYQPHNLYVNSGSPANQAITVASGQTYKLLVTGTVSITASGAATGTATAGSPLSFTAATTTLTLGSTSGSGTAAVFATPADETYVATSGSAKFGLAYDFYTSGTQRGILVEPAATNLVTDSQDFTAWNNTNSTDAANATGPDGVANSASTITAQAGSGEHYVWDNVTVAAAANQHSISFFAKAGTTDFVACNFTGGGPGLNSSYAYDLSDGTLAQTFAAGDKTPTIEPCGNGWYRITQYDTTNGTGGTPPLNIGPHDGSGSATWTAVGTETVQIYGAQVEIGSVPTSLIQTYGSTATRDADDISKAVSALPYADGAAGTVYVEYSPKITTGTLELWSFGNGGTNSARTTLQMNGGFPRVYINSGQLDDLYTQQTATNATNRHVVAFDTNDMAHVSESGAVETDTSGALATGAVDFSIGQSPSNATVFKGHIRRLIYLPRRVSNVDIEAWADTGDLP